MKFPKNQRIVLLKNKEGTKRDVWISLGRGNKRNLLGKHGAEFGDR